MSPGVHRASIPMDPTTTSDDRPIITWTVPMLRRFQRAIKQAQEDNLDTFEFDGHQFVRRYAEYLQEYLQGEFGSSSSTRHNIPMTDNTAADEIRPGPNAKAFIKHVEIGLSQCESYKEMDSWVVYHEHLGAGLAFLQDPEDPESMLVAVERGLIIGNSQQVMLFNEQQPPSLIAALVIGTLASGSRLTAPNCPAHEEEA